MVNIIVTNAINEIVSGTKTLAATGLSLSVTTICVLYYYLNSDEQDREPGFKDEANWNI
jgi:hypothetical protein